MKCVTPDKIRKLATKQLRQMIDDTSRWSIVAAVWILFDKFSWSRDRVEYFLNRYDEQSDMIAPLSERYIEFDERSKLGYTFDEIHEEVDLDITLKNSRQQGGKVEQTIGYLQDRCLHWILDVMLNTLKNKCGWGETMCRRFASYYNSEIPEFDNAQQYCDITRQLIYDKYGFDLVVRVK